MPAQLEALFAGEPVDLVVHLGALAGVRESIAHPERFFEVNVMGTLRLVEAARRAGVTRLVYASSSSVYGQDSPLPFREDAACAQPVSPYAASKRAAELQLVTVHHLHQMAVTSLRFFTAYGPRQRPDLAIHKFTRLIEAGQPASSCGATVRPNRTTRTSTTSPPVWWRPWRSSWAIRWRATGCTTWAAASRSRWRAWFA